MLCLICFQPGATEPRYSGKGAHKFTKGHVHRSCADAKANQAARKAKAKKAKRWEEAGQQPFPEAL